MKNFKLSLLGLLVACAANADVDHTPFGPIKIGERAKVEAQLTDAEPIKSARLYFKSNLSDKFSYVDLDMSGSSIFAQLPAPGPTMQAIEYFFAVKYSNGELEQTPVYGLNIDGQWDEAVAKQYAQALAAYTELDKEDDDSLSGFVDNVRSGFQAAKLLNKLGSAVELSSFSNFTVVSGPTSAAAGGAASSSSTFGSNAGVIAGGAAAAAALALAAGGGGGSKGSFEEGAVGTPPEKKPNYSGSRYHGTMTFTSAPMSTCTSFNVVFDDAKVTQSGKLPKQSPVEMKFSEDFVFEGVLDSIEKNKASVNMKFGTGKPQEDNEEFSWPVFVMNFEGEVSTEFKFSSKGTVRFKRTSDSCEFDVKFEGAVM